MSVSAVAKSRRKAAIRKRLGPKTGVGSRSARGRKVMVTK
jgi:hypothetical protein